MPNVKVNYQAPEPKYRPHGWFSPAAVFAWVVAVDCVVGILLLISGQTFLTTEDFFLNWAILSEIASIAAVLLLSAVALSGNTREFTRVNDDILAKNWAIAVLAPGPTTILIPIVLVVGVIVIVIGVAASSSSS